MNGPVYIVQRGGWPRAGGRSAGQGGRGASGGRDAGHATSGGAERGGRSACAYANLVASYSATAQKPFLHSQGLKTCKSENNVACRAKPKIDAAQIARSPPGP